MPRYLLKGLGIALLILAVIVGAGYGLSYFLSTSVDNGVNAAREQGYTAGYSQGYDDGIARGIEDGYQAGGKLGYASSGGGDALTVSREGSFFLYNPTHDEVVSAAASSGAGTAQELLDYARANGIRAAYVRVPIARPASEGRVYLYQLVAFETVDSGLIMIEPASRREVKVEVGQSYSILNGFPPSSFDDTITKVTVVW